MRALGAVGVAGLVVIGLACGGTNIGGPVPDTGTRPTPVPVDPTPTPSPSASGLGSGEPLYGVAALASGFGTAADVQVRAGGMDDARSMNLGDGCVGHIASAQPDYRVVYTGTGGTLRFAACADSDTALILRDPSGNVVCNDDAEGRNPVVDVKGVTAGNYDVWVATYSEGSAQDAVLKITEAPGGICAHIDPSGPAATNQSLSRGFGENVMPVQAGGATDIGMIPDLGCTGHIRSEGPTVRLQLGAGDGPLFIGACAPTDLTLAVHGPGDRWTCNDDYQEHDPYVEFAMAPTGTYDVYVGTYGEGENPTVDLRFSETNVGPCGGAGK